MRRLRAISLLEVSLFGIVIPLNAAVCLIYILDGRPLSAVAPLIWSVLIVANWLEFRRWRRGSHRLLRQTARDRDAFSREVFLMKATAASSYASHILGLGLRDNERARHQLQALYLAVAMHELPEDAEPHLLQLRDSAAAVARGGEAKELLH